MVFTLVAVIGSNVGMNAAENITEQRQALDTLSNAKTFDDDVAGERPGNGQSPLYATFHKLVVAKKPLVRNNEIRPGLNKKFWPVAAAPAREISG
jgi:hypothetical protein